MLIRLQIALFTFLCSLYVFTASGKPWIEAGHQFRMSQQFVRTFSVSTPDIALELSQGSENTRIQGPNGRWYDYHGTANLFVMTPPALLGRILEGRVSADPLNDLQIFLASLTGAVISSWACLFFFQMLRLFGRPIRVAVAATLALGALTLVFPYAVTNYEGNLNMLAVMGSLLGLFRYERNGRLWDLIASACWTGLALNTRDFSLLLVGSASMYVLWLSVRRRRPQPALVFLGSFVPWLAFWAWMNSIRTGSPFLTPITLGIIEGKFVAAGPGGNLLEGLVGLLFSPGGSIFAYSPILLLALPGVRHFFLQTRPQSFLVFGLLACWFLALAKVPEWFGFYCWGPRYTLEVVPLMLLPAAWCAWFERPISKLWTSVAWIIAAWSAVIQLSGVLTSWFSRMPHVLHYGRAQVIATVHSSQWWDSVRILGINLWNMTLGNGHFIENPGHFSDLSAASLYTARTIEPWWNRILFQGAPPWSVGLVIVILLAAIAWSAWQLWRQVKIISIDEEFTADQQRAEPKSGPGTSCTARV